MLLTAPEVLVVCFRMEKPLSECETLFELNAFASAWLVVENLLLAMAAEGLYGVTILIRGRGQVPSILLQGGQAAPEMRRVRFSLRDRITVIPVEVVHALWPMFVATAVVLWFSGPLAAAAVVAAILAGEVLFPILLPWLPTRDFGSKGFILGGLVALPFALVPLLRRSDAAWWERIGGALTSLLPLVPVTAYLALNLTGSTTFTSRSAGKLPSVRLLLRRQHRKQVEPQILWSARTC